MKGINKELLICLLLLSPFRAVSFLLLPVIALIIFRQFKLKTNKASIKFCLLLFFISSIINLIQENCDIRGIAITIWLFIPLLILFLSSVKKANYSVNLHKLAHNGDYLMITINLVGNLCALSGFNKGNPSLLYGNHYEMVHGLAICNIMFAAYHLSFILTKKGNAKNYILTIFYFISFIIDQFGLGILAFFSAVLFWLIIQGKIKYYSILICTIFLGTIALSSKYFSYIDDNINHGINDQDNARKVIMFKSTEEILRNNLNVVIFGVGPGGYNSRMEQLLNKDANNPFTKILGQQEPRFYKEYIYPLWNKSFVSQSTYTDGTRNKPFSSLIAILIEFGVPFFLIVYVYWIYKIIRYQRRSKGSQLYTFLTLLNIHMLTQSIVHEWFVCTEFLFYLVLEIYTLNEIKKRNIKSTLLKDNLKETRI